MWFYKWILVALFLICSINLTNEVSPCQQALVNTFQNTTFLLKQVILSGKYFNELGNYNQCEFQEKELSYALSVIHNDSLNVFDIKYVWGFCISKNCTNTTSLLTMDQFLRESSSLDNLNFENAAIEYLTPFQNLQDQKQSRYIVLWIMLSVIFCSFLLGIFGIVVEYTSVGNSTLSHEETNFANIDIPIIQEGNTKDQLRQIMMIKDELLRNSKKLWASIVLCFSFTRNLRHLFYKIKIQSEKLRHRNAMYFILFFGFVWHIIFSATYVGMITYPKNIFTLPTDLAQIMYIINHGGQLFGLNLIFFAYGYLAAVNFLNYANFIPKEFNKIKLDRRRNQSSFSSLREEASNIEQVSFGNQDSENRYYIKRQQFVFLVGLFRKYFRLFVPILFATLGILYILPFLSDGPIYLVALRTQFLIPCEYGWYLNLTFIQNLLYWGTTYDSTTCNPYIANGVTSSTHTKLSDSQCQYTCGMYLQVFASLFQFFIFCPFLMYLHKYFRRISYLVILLLIFGSLSAVFAIVSYYGIQAYLFFDTQYITLLLHRPWFRLPSFLVGLLFGLIIARIHALQIQIYFGRLGRLFMYFSGSILCFTTLFFLQVNNNCYSNSSLGFNQKGCFSSLESGLYTALAPMIFLFGVIMILVPTVSEVKMMPSENFGFKALLMYDGWRILHKLTVTAFICHYLVIFWYYASIHSTGLILCKWTITKVAYGTLVLAYVFGFFYYLLIDKPIRNIDRLVLFPTKISDSFLVKRQQKSKARKEKVRFAEATALDGPNQEFNPTQSEGNETSNNVSDESEDEDTTTYRRAHQKILEGSRLTESQYIHGQARGSSYDDNGIDGLSFMGSHENTMVAQSFNQPKYNPNINRSLDSQINSSFLETVNNSKVSSRKANNNFKDDDQYY